MGCSAQCNILRPILQGPRSDLLLRKSTEVLPIGILASAAGEIGELLGSDETLSPGDLLDAGDLQALPFFEGFDEGAGLEQGVMGAGVEPGEAAAAIVYIPLPVFFLKISPLCPASTDKGIN